MGCPIWCQHDRTRLEYVTTGEVEGHSHHAVLGQAGPVGVQLVQWDWNSDPGPVIEVELKTQDPGTLVADPAVLREVAALLLAAAELLE